MKDNSFNCWWFQKILSFITKEPTLHAAANNESGSVKPLISKLRSDLTTSARFSGTAILSLNTRH